ncbi:MAG: zinc ribbon domain-containing protein [Nitrospira sp.]|nr:zinc ribbon domain-containing protein [Nitrospira sp.]
MPVYEYRCEACSTHFEATQSVHDRIEDTECPSCHARQATRLLSSFSSKIVGTHKPGFAEMKAAAMNQERMERFAKLPPLDKKRNMPRPNAYCGWESPSQSDTPAES